MSNLVVIGFDETHKAEDVRLKLQKLQSEYLLDLADVVVSVKDETGKVQLHHAGNLITDTAVCQGFCGSLANLILLNAAAGAASGALTDVGINDHFMKELIATLIPSSSALFVLTRRPTPDRERLLEELKGLSGKIFNAAFARRPSQTAGCLKRRKISRPLGLSGFPERHHEYHSKVLGRLATLLNLYGQAQASGSDLMLSNRL